MDTVRTTVCRRLAKIALAIAFAVSFALLTGTAQQVWADTGALVVSSHNELQTQAKSKTFRSPDGLIEINDITSGKVKYNKKKHTLTLGNMKASTVTFQKSGTLNLKLVGTSKVDIENLYDDKPKGSLVIAGSGTLVGSIHLKGNLAMKKGTVKAKAGKDTSWKEENYIVRAIRCNKFTMTGGKISATATDDWFGACGVQGKTFKMTGGTLIAKGTCPVHAAYGVYANNFSQTGGKLTANGNSGDDLAMGVACTNMKVSKRANLVASAKSTSYDSEKAAFGIVCASFTMDKGSVRTSAKGDVGVIGLLCENNMRVKGGTIAISKMNAGDKAKTHCAISCMGSLTMSGGKIVCSGCSGAMDGVFAIGKITLNGGTLAVSKLAASGYQSAVASNGGITVNGGTMKVSNCNGYGVFCQGDDLRLQKGSLIVDQQFRGGSINVYEKDFVMTGGVLKATGCWEDAVRVAGSDCGFYATGGKVTLKVLYPSLDYAISASTIDYYAADAVSISGKEGYDA